MNDYPWEPPIAGTEVQHLIGALERMRTTFRWKADGLDSAALQTTIGASSITMGGLLKHLAVQEDHMFRTKFLGKPLGPPWDVAKWSEDEDWEFSSAADDSPEVLYALWDDATERARAAVDQAMLTGGLDQPAHISWPDGRHASLRRLVFDRLEEYSRHTGHADLLREAIDGRTGEDPPAGWRPISGNYRLPNLT